MRGVVQSLLLLGTLVSPLHADFHSDCSDQQRKEVACSVHVVDCSLEVVPRVADGQEPAEAHDVRVEALAKAPARSSEPHHLHVDVSWQLPPHNSSSQLKAFRLRIDQDEDAPSCFLFNISAPAWDEETISSSPRFHFSSESIFEFDGAYRISLESLPRSNSLAPRVIQHALMPSNPEDKPPPQHNVSDYCETHSNPAAAKWTAGFRRIFLHSLARTIQIEFVGAPSHYCFEAYEVRLLDESGLELLHQHIVGVDSMREEVIENKTVLFGEYNFTNLELETDYIPSVIPVERSVSGRCLCPIDEGEGICSCIAAEWKKVRLHRYEKPFTPCTNCHNVTLPTPEAATPRYWFDPRDEGPRESCRPVAAFVILLVLLLCVAGLIYLLLFFYRKYRNRGKAVRIRFITENRPSQGGLDVPHTPLICAPRHNVYIVYAHDCVLHEAVVAAFADYLRDAFHLNVHLDSWDSDELDENLAEYIHASLARADKVLVVNSTAAFHRCLARASRDGAVERLQQGPLDFLFDTQIDLALQHAHVISTRFSYTSLSQVLFALHSHLQYSIPDNLALLGASLTDSQPRSDPRTAGYSSSLATLHAAITRMHNFQTSEPNWFEKTHHRVARPVVPRPIAVQVVDEECVRVEEEPSPSPLPCIEIDAEVEAGPSCEDSGTASLPDTRDEPLDSAFYSGVAPSPPPSTESETEEVEAEEEEEAGGGREIVESRREKLARDPNGDSGLVADFDSIALS